MDVLIGITNSLTFAYTLLCGDNTSIFYTNGLVSEPQLIRQHRNVLPLTHIVPLLQNSTSLNKRIITKIGFVLFVHNFLWK